MHHVKPLITNQKGKQKAGRGFSAEEIKQAGITKQQAQKLQVPIDPRRKTAHQENVDAIKAHLQKPKS